MKEIIYRYNSGEFSSDGENLILRKDRAASALVRWSTITAIEAEENFVVIGGQRNYTHLLIFRFGQDVERRDWRMPNGQSTDEARTALLHYRALHGV